MKPQASRNPAGPGNRNPYGVGDNEEEDSVSLEGVHLAYGVGQRRTARRGRSACGRLVDIFVKLASPQPTGLQGLYELNLGRSMAVDATGLKRLGIDRYNMPKGTLAIDGFRAELTEGGQGSDVYKHLFGHAGAVLIGHHSIYFGSLHITQSGYDREGYETFQDIDQRDHPENHVPHTAEEAATEVLDDFAGAQAGELMRDTIEGRLNPEDLRNRLFGLLCDH